VDKGAFIIREPSMNESGIIEGERKERKGGGGVLKHCPYRWFACTARVNLSTAIAILAEGLLGPVEWGKEGGRGGKGEGEKKKRTFSGCAAPGITRFGGLFAALRHALPGGNPKRGKEEGERKGQEKRKPRAAKDLPCDDKRDCHNMGQISCRTLVY